MNFTTAFYSSIGGRDTNEDSVRVAETKGSFVGAVCDGLGGLEDGEIASRIAADTIIDYCKDKVMSPSMIENAFQLANESVFLNAGNSGMRTTASVVWLEDEDGLMANVGDTRIYQFRNGKIISQSKDHSIAWFSYYKGEISEEDIRKNKDRNKLIRALGCADEVRTDIYTLNICSGDAFLICSDGLWEPVLEEDMITLLRKSESVEQWLHGMRSLVEDRTTDKGDNHSAIAVWAR